MNLVKNIKVTRVMNAVAAGTGDTQTGTGVNMQGFEGVIFIAEFGTLTAGAVTALKAQQSSDNGSSDAYADLSGTAQSIVDTAGNDCLVLDIYRPAERYVRPAITRATANAVIDSVIAIQYGARKMPTTNDAATVAGTETHVSPAEGTA